MVDRIHARMKYLSIELKRLHPQFKRYQLLFRELVSLELERRNRVGLRGPTGRCGGAWTVDRVRQLPGEEFYRYEIDGGVLLVSPRPSSLHQVASRRIANLLDDAITAAGADLSVALAGSTYEEIAVTRNPIRLTRPTPVDIHPSRLLRRRSDL